MRRVVKIDCAATKDWGQYVDTKNKAEVLRQLHDLGYKDLVQRTFYQDCKDGKCRRNTSGLYSRRMVKKYVEVKGILRAGDSFVENGPDHSLSVERQKRENEKLKLDNEIRVIKRDKLNGNLIEREGIYLELAARVVALETAFTARIIEDAAPRYIAAVGGCIDKLAELQDLLRDDWDDMMNSFCTTDTFEVLFDDNDADDADIDEDI